MPPGGYVEDLRRAVGTRVLIVPGACVAIRDNTGRVLLQPLEVYSGPAFFHTYPSGDLVYHVGVAFQTRDMRGELRPDPAEVAELEFFPLDALPSPLQRSARQHLEEIQRRELR
jgi:hypothetical protein